MDRKNQNYLILQLIKGVPLEKIERPPGDDTKKQELTPEEIPWYEGDRIVLPG